MRDGILFWVLLIVANYAFMVLLSLGRRSQPQPQAAAIVGKLLVRLPSGYGIGRAWRRYVQAVLDLRQAQPEEAREAVAALLNSGGAAPRLLADRAAQRVRAADRRLDGALRSAGRSDLEPVLRGRAWRAAIRLWAARGYPW